MADFSLRTVEAGARRSGTVLSDPPSDPLAYHALSAFMLDIAVRELGPEASKSARRARLATMEALAVFLSPDGDVSWLGRGQAQVWVPALAAAALVAGARAHPARAPRYLGAARVALRRLERLHATRDRGFDVVPGAPERTTTNGIDPYVHTVAYNGLTLFGLGVARDSLRDVRGRTPLRKPPATRRLRVADPEGTGLGIVANRRVWLGRPRLPPQHQRPAPRLRPARAQAAHARRRLARHARRAAAHGREPGVRRARARAPRHRDLP